ncbi:MAG TPA: hypothetical protein VNG51_22000 [Ktedonobacteraceae bacterium]|nr:hypothetical protein [Ktedonobacteraceae bacterium]
MSLKDPLLITKLHFPSLPCHLVSRPRLIAQLNGALKRTGHQEQITHCNINSIGIGAQAHNYMVLVNGTGGGQLLIGVGPILNNNQDFSFEWHQSS